MCQSSIYSTHSWCCQWYADRTNKTITTCDIKTGPSSHSYALLVPCSPPFSWHRLGGWLPLWTSFFHGIFSLCDTYSPSKFWADSSDSLGGCHLSEHCYQCCYQCCFLMDKSKTPAALFPVDLTGPYYLFIPGDLSMDSHVQQMYNHFICDILPPATFGQLYLMTCGCHVSIFAKL